MKKMSWNSFLTEDKEHEESLAGFIKKAQVFTEHSFHVKKDVFENDMPSLEAMGFQGLPLLREDTQRFWVLFINRVTIIYLIVPSEIFIDYYHHFKFGEHKQNKNSYHLLSSWDVI